MKTYFSKSGHLSIGINHGRLVTMGQYTQRIDEKIIAFSPTGDGAGVLSTDDKEVQDWIEQAIASGKRPDLMTEQQYLEYNTPDSVRASMLEQENKRLLTEYNKLLADMKNGKVGSK